MSNELKCVIGKNTLNELFFSPENTQIIQNAIRKNVYIKTLGKHLISNQSRRELYIIMRSIYLQHGKNRKTDISGQIRELNKRVVDDSVPKIISGIKQYIGYKKNINTLPTPMMLPRNMSKAGSKGLTNPLF